MRKLLSSFFFLITFIVIPLQASERDVGTLDNVDLIVSDLYNEDRHNYGEEYFVLNRNDHPMRVSIKLTESKNVEDHIIRYTIIVEPHDRVGMGFVLQDEVSKGADWKYTWEAGRDTPVYNFSSIERHEGR